MWLDHMLGKQNDQEHWSNPNTKNVQPPSGTILFNTLHSIMILLLLFLFREQAVACYG